MTIERNDLSLDAVKIDGAYIEDLVPGYQTIKAIGRETLQRTIETINLAKDGERLKKTKYPAREIEVTFYVKRDTLADMRESMTTLMSILDKVEKTIIFNGDSDYYYTGTPIIDNSFTETKNGLIGTFVINCFDPFKYALNQTTVTASGGEFNVSYSGTAKAYPEFEVSFPATRDSSGNNTDESECGYVGFAQMRNNNDFFLQFGDPNEKDYADIVRPAKTVLNKTFNATSDWTLNESATLGSSYVQAGTITQNTTDKYMYPSGYGSGSAFHGPCVSKILSDTTGATNFKFTWKQKFNVSAKKQYGCSSILLYNKNGNTRTLIAGVHLQKKTDDKNTKISFYADGTTAKETVTKACSKIGGASIEKSGTTATITIGGVTKQYQLSSTTANLIVNEVVFYFGQNKTKTVMSSNYIYSCTRQRYSYIDKNVDIENTFQPGDVLTVNTKDATVFLDSGTADVPADYLGALGNDWEDFVLVPGNNTIAVDYSSFATTPPVFTMKYRERFL